MGRKLLLMFRKEKITLATAGLSFLSTGLSLCAPLTKMLQAAFGAIRLTGRKRNVGSKKSCIEVWLTTDLPL